MRLEVFSCGKLLDRPQDNEDAFVVAPGLGYAVIDGVTDRSGTSFGSERGGRFAARRVQQRVTRFLLDEDLAQAGGAARVARLLNALRDALREGYAQHDRLDAAMAAPEARAGCTLALAMRDGAALRVISIGDSGVRLRGAFGAWSHVDGKPLDTITSLMRRETWRALETAGAPLDAIRRIADAVVSQGLAAPPQELAPTLAASLRGTVAAVCRVAAPGVSEASLARMIDGGVGAQRLYANRDDLDLGYGVIDGTDVPPRHVHTHEVALAEVASVELFSDGYFDVPDNFSIAAWEAAFDRVEAEDPHKIGRFASMKGSTERSWTDDRTYLGALF